MMKYIDVDEFLNLDVGTRNILDNSGKVIKRRLVLVNHLVIISGSTHSYLEEGLTETTLRRPSNTSLSNRLSSSFLICSVDNSRDRLEYCLEDPAAWAASIVNSLAMAC